MADAVEIVAARATFLAAGHYAPLERALAETGRKPYRLIGQALQPVPPGSVSATWRRPPTYRLFLIGTLGYTPLEIGLRVLPLSVGGGDRRARDRDVRQACADQRLAAVHHGAGDRGHVSDRQLRP
ncbi:hypothetical protein GCM10010412_081690 [Nonomuraea recticatena]|uniref:Uncharacterized protein n=1 Tax=Nonomuraea recticatena TaxID=46178 RepID=A0ABN3T4Z3_9ACTN